MTGEDYLKNHGIDPMFVSEKFGWTWDSDKITIPVFDENGEKLWNRYRWLNNDQHKFTTDVGSHPEIYPSNLINKENILVLCEGESDCIKLWQEGIPAVTVSGVGTFNKEHAEYLRGKAIYVCLDNDEAGQKNVLRYCEILSLSGCNVKIVNLPSQFKDISEYFVGGGTIKEFKNLIENAKSYVGLELDDFSKRYPIKNNDEFLSVDYPQPKWIIENLIRQGGISFIVGESGTGKTIFTLSIAKSIREGALWLGKFKAESMNILRLDKENTSADIKKLEISMGVTQNGIYHLNDAIDDYQLIDNKGELTSFAKNIQQFIKTKNINLVILDSVIDFLVGDESSSVDVKANINKWKEIFADCSILGIHHEGKTPIGGRRNSKDRMRGSSHWLAAAQSVISLSVISPTSPEILLVEHTKVRGGAKLKPFEIEMVIRPDPFNKGETKVDGFKYIREVADIILRKEEAISLIKEFLFKENDWLSSDEIIKAVKTDSIGTTNIRAAINQMFNDGDLERRGLGKRGNPYIFELSLSANQELTEKAIKNLEEENNDVERNF